MRVVVVSVAACLLGACAQARQGAPVDADPGNPNDAKVYLDGQIEGPVDARTDAQTVNPTDAAPDAYQCVNMNRQLLANPAFDLAPVGTGWVQQPFDAAYPLVTADDGVPEHSAPYKVWLGGLSGEEYFVTSVTDGAYQDIAIPMGTTQLTITGQYDVRSSELPTTTAYDTMTLALTQTNGTPIETILTASNLMTKTAWTPFSKAFAANLSGQTVRVRMTSTNDITDPTSFFFDTFDLTAVVCQ